MIGVNPEMAGSSGEARRWRLSQSTSTHFEDDDKSVRTI